MVEPGRVDGLKVGRVDGDAFGVVREGAARGVTWRCGWIFGVVGLTAGRVWGTTRCGVGRGATCGRGAT